MSMNNKNDLVSTLKKFGFVHSIILFGSQAKGTQRNESDVDICIIAKQDADINLKDRIALSNSVEDNIDISLLDELPVYIRKRIFLEGKVLYSEDPFYILTLAKETDIEYERYQKFRKDYHKAVMQRVRMRIK